MTYQVAIPSYKRPRWLAERTLNALISGKVPSKQITVFVHDNDPHLDAYVDIAESLGVNLKATPARGIIEQRQYIHDSYPDGTELVQVDDDVSGYSRLHEGKLAPARSVDKLFSSSFTITKREGLTAWGLYPVNNHFFMKPGYSTDLKFLIYTTVGVIVKKGHPAVQNTVETKDDYEHSLRRWWWDGGVVRRNNFTAHAAVYKGEGGLSGSPVRTSNRTELAVVELERQWGDKVRRNQNRKSELPEILLGRGKRHAGKPFGTPPPGVS